MNPAIDHPGALGGPPTVPVSAIAPLAAHARSSSYGCEMPVEVIDGESFARSLLDPEWREAPITSAISPCTPIELEAALHISIPPSVPRLLVGVLRTPQASAPTLDLVVSSDEELERVAAACAANPQAVVVLAQLLRSSEQLDVEAALLAESFAYSTLLGGSEFARWRAATRPRRHQPASEPISVDDDGECLTITLNRPDVRNAYDAALRDALIDVLRSAYAMGPGRDVFLRGAGQSFCSGGDLTEFGTSSDATLAHLIRTTRAPGLLLHHLGDRARARVHGACIGAGTEVPAFCSHVSAHPDATFQLPESSMGLIPGAGGTVSVTRRIGRQRTMWFAATGTVVDASTALSWGLVDAVSKSYP
jgi:enoyl-CoA hydratase/carnithine racemase